MPVDQRDDGAGLPEGFLSLPEAIYAGDDQWIPEDGDSVARRFSPENTWFQSNRAISLCIPGAARAVGFLNPDLRIDGQVVAFFGWENTET